MVHSPNVTRFDGWVGLMVFSGVSLGSLLDITGSNNRGWRENYFLSASVISGGLALIIVLLHFPKSIHSKVIGKSVEVAVGFVALVLWCLAIAVAQNPNNNLATTETLGVETVTNANIYFFSWATFIAAIYVTASAAQSARGVEGLKVAATSLKFAKWLMLVVVGVVVFASASQLKKDSGVCDQNTDTFVNKTCKRTKYAVALGTSMAFLAIIMCFLTMKKGLSSIIQAFLASISTLMYGVGVALITGSEGPGSQMGNLYFFTWGGFILSCKLAVDSIVSYMSAKKEGAFGSTPTTEEKKDPEIADDGTPVVVEEVNS